MVEIKPGGGSRAARQSEFLIFVFKAPVHQKPESGGSSAELAGVDRRPFSGYWDVRNPVLSKNQFSSPPLKKAKFFQRSSPENGRRPPQQLAVPLCDPVPDSPNVFPALKAGTVEESLLDPIGVITSPPWKMVDFTYLHLSQMWVR